MGNQFQAERKFGLSLGGVLLILSVLAFFRRGSYLPFLAAAGLILVLMAIFFPSKLTILKTGWFKAGRFVGQVNTIVLLSLLYWIFITPVGFLMKLFGKDLLALNFDREAKTYWKDRAPGEDTDMNRQF